MTSTEQRVGERMGAVTLVALVAAGIGLVAMIATLVQEAQALAGI